MPIDPNILLKGRLPKIQSQTISDVLAPASQYMQLSQLANKQRAAEKQMAEQKALGDIYRQNVVMGEGGTPSLDRPAILSDLYQFDPQLALRQQTTFEQMDLASQKRRLEAAMQENKAIARLTYSVKDQPSYETARQQAIEMELEGAEKLPLEYDKGLVDRLQFDALNTEQRLNQKWKEKQSTLGRYDALRGQREAKQITKDTGKMSVTYNKLQNAARLGFDAYEKNEEKSAQSADIAMVFGIMKMFDPQSTVREGEYATAKQAGSIPGRIMNWYNTLVGGYTLNNDQRASFLRTAESQYLAQLAGQKQVDENYTMLAKAEGLDPKRTVLKVRAQKVKGRLLDYMNQYGGIGSSYELPEENVPDFPSNHGIFIEQARQKARRSPKRTGRVTPEQSARRVPERVDDDEYEYILFDEETGEQRVVNPLDFLEE